MSTPLRTDGPLAGRRVAVTREEEPGSGLAALLAERGAVPLDWCAVRTAPPAEQAPVRDAAARLDEFDWLVVTSPRAVQAVAGILGNGATLPPDLAVAAVGRSTAELATESGWQVERIPDDAGAAGLLALFREAGDADGSKVLFPASTIARDDLEDGLRELGAHVTRVDAYSTIPGLRDPARVEADLDAGGADVLTFASPSAVEGVVDGLGRDRFLDLLSRTAVAVIGPTTATSLAGCDPPRLVTATEATLTGLVDAAIQSLEE